MKNLIIKGNVLIKSSTPPQCELIAYADVDGPGVVASGEDTVDANYSWKIYVGLGARKYTKTVFALSPAS